MNRFFLFLFFSFSSIIFAEGFAEDTLVATLQGLVSVQECEVGDPLLAAKPGGPIRVARVAAARKITSDYVVHIVLENDELITASPSQKLYVVHKEKWVSAKNLQRGDKLLAIDGNAIAIYSVYLLFEPTELYLLSLKKPHTFAVSSVRVLAHNFALPAVAIPLFVYTIGEGFAWAGAGAMFSAFFGSIFRGYIDDYNARQTLNYRAVLKAQNNEPADVINGDAYCCTLMNGAGGGPEDPKGPKKSGGGGNSDQSPKKAEKKRKERQSLGNEKSDERKSKVKHSADDPRHKNGLYEDASYHHQNSRGSKSPSPINGQGALDNSIEVNIKGVHRIGWSCGQLVAFKQTCRNVFHGYTVKLSELGDRVKSAIANSKIMKF